MRFKNPWRRALLLTLGWYVLFIINFSLNFLIFLINYSENPAFGQLGSFGDFSLKNCKKIKTHIFHSISTPLKNNLLDKRILWLFTC
jgi:hypothetical protein